jgi:hypothetical protein
MNAEQAYLFDLNGYIVLPGVLQPRVVAALLEANRDRQIGGAKTATGDGKTGTLHWSKGYRDLLLHPIVSPILAELCGPNFRLDHISVHSRGGADDPANRGGKLHGNHDFLPGGGNGFYEYRGGRFLNGLTTVAYELEDTRCNGGGFCCALP